MVQFLQQVARTQVAGIEIDLSDKYKIHNPTPSFEIQIFLVITIYCQVSSMNH